MNEHALRYALPHFRPVSHPKRRAVLGDHFKNKECLVCGLPLAASHKDTIHFFHGACRKDRVALRRR